MLAPFEYICRCSTGSELYAALQLKDVIKAKIDHQNLSIPYSGMYSPCSRCWIYDPIIDQEYCPLCQKINDMSMDHGLILQEFTLVWAYFPTPKWTGEPILPKSTLGFFIKDCQHVLIMCPKSSIQDWLKSLALLYSEDLKGLVQVFPTMGKGEVICMGDILSRAIHQESAVQPNKLWIRFFPEAWQLLEAKKRDEQGILTFSASDFIAFIDKSKIYSDIIPYRFRSDIYELLTSTKIENKPYYWGKVQKSLSKKAIDLIDAWQLRSWDSLQVQTLYSLLQYANPTRSY